MISLYCLSLLILICHYSNCKNNWGKKVKVVRLINMDSRSEILFFFNNYFIEKRKAYVQQCMHKLWTKQGYTHFGEKFQQNALFLKLFRDMSLF